MISVIILNWNGKQYLNTCLASLRMQSFQDFETLLVDNGSNDGSVDFVRNQFPEVKVISLSYNSGFCVGNNIGIRHASGNLIGLLNNDTEVSPDWLSSLSQTAIKHPEIGFFASKMVFYDRRNIIDTAGDGFHIAGFGFKRGWQEVDSPLFNQPDEVFGACAGAALYRKDMLDQIGLLDEDFFANGEDVDLSFRAQLYGFKCLYVPEAMVYHKGGATIGQDNYWFYLIRRNQIWTMVKNMPGPLIIKYFPLVLFYNLTSLIYHSLNGRRYLITKAYLDAFKMLPQMYAKRNRIQNERVVGNDYLESIMTKSGLIHRARNPMSKNLSSSYTERLHINNL